ncbi:hypothetical protein P12x_002241 [Tundrisphaera lichenicola]|uniref:hypothetical protein n=1 Tax=Tundrisphaera lichenicola TaxID=2029860 RepID=UPI003EBF1657
MMMMVAFNGFLFLVLAIVLAAQAKNEAQKLRGELDALKKELRQNGLIVEPFVGSVKITSPEL